MTTACSNGTKGRSYTLIMGVPNPMIGGHPLRFGNTTQDQARGGWLTLGTFVVAP